MSNPRVRVKVAEKAQQDELLLIKTLIMHRMETGLRSNHDGDAIARHIINRFVCKLENDVIFEAELHPAMAANPYLEFHMVAARSGRLSFEWHEDGGKVYTAQRQIHVS